MNIQLLSWEMEIPQFFCDLCPGSTLIFCLYHRWNLNNSERYALQYVDGQQAYITELVSAFEKDQPDVEKMPARKVIVWQQKDGN